MYSNRRIDAITQYLIKPSHPISVGLIGCGATGSEVARHLAKMHGSLIALGHPGFYVVASDPDVIGNENTFRQPYNENEIGLNKAVQLMTRINRSFGTQWKSEYLDWNDCLYENRHYEELMLKPNFSHNILITCVDSVKTRRIIKEALTHQYPQTDTYATSMLWIDFGNDFDFGQVVMTNIDNENTFHETSLCDLFDIYPNATDLPEEASCSLSISLGRQDLFINSILADLGMRMLWGYLRRAKIEYNCIFVNLQKDEPVKTKLILKNENRNLLLPISNKVIASEKSKTTRRIVNKTVRT